MLELVGKFDCMVGLPPVENTVYIIIFWAGKSACQLRNNSAVNGNRCVSLQARRSMKVSKREGGRGELSLTWHLLWARTEAPFPSSISFHPHVTSPKKMTTPLTETWENEVALKLSNLSTELINPKAPNPSTGLTGGRCIFHLANAYWAPIMQQALLQALGIAMRKTQPVPSGSAHSRAEAQIHTQALRRHGCSYRRGQGYRCSYAHGTDMLTDVCVALDIDVVTIDGDVDKHTGLDMD